MSRVERPIPWRDWRGCRRSHGVLPGMRFKQVQYSSRFLDVDILRRWPVLAVALGPNAASATVHWCCERPGPHRPADGAAKWSRGGTARECGHGQLRALAVGTQRTAEELGQAFSPVPVITSSGGKVVQRVSAAPALVIATPGAEPAADQGYAAALLLDAWALLGRADLRASEEAVRRWFNASALVRPRTAGGEVVLVADSTLRPVQALVRWDPVGHAARELDDRIATGMPPARRVALLTGTPASLTDLMARAALPSDVVTLGPTPFDDGRMRSLLSVALPNALAMTKALKGATGERSARKTTDIVKVVVDPVNLGS